jgi:hypothetical protein
MITVVDGGQALGLLAFLAFSFLLRSLCTREQRHNVFFGSDRRFPLGKGLTWSQIEHLASGLVTSAMAIGDRYYAKARNKNLRQVEGYALCAMPSEVIRC